MATPPPPSDALALIFEQLEVIYEKLCEGSVLLSLTGCPILIDATGNFASFAIEFDNLETPERPAIEAIIGIQFIDFTQWLDQLVAGVTGNPNPNNTPVSDCEKLKICNLKNALNIQIKTLENVAMSPDGLSQKVASTIESLKNQITTEIEELTPAIFTTPKVWNKEGKLLLSGDDAKFTFANPTKSDAIGDIEKQVNEIYTALVTGINKALVPEATT